MSRAARIVVPNMAHHVVHRAYNGEPIFLTDEDYRYYITNLDELRNSLGCKVYAFCLMLNHVHLLVDPGSDATNLARLMKCLAGRQAQRVKKLENRSGPVWEGRFRSSPVAPEFLLPCARYIELNPVRALLTNEPEGYLWSSARSRLGLARLPLDFDPAYLSLGETPRDRIAHYRPYLHAPVPIEEWAKIRQAIQNANLTGGDDFRATVVTHFGFRLPACQRGRPRTAAKATEDS